MADLRKRQTAEYTHARTAQAVAEEQARMQQEKPPCGNTTALPQRPEPGLIHGGVIIHVCVKEKGHVDSYCRCWCDHLFRSIGEPTKGPRHA